MPTGLSVLSNPYGQRALRVVARGLLAGLLLVALAGPARLAAQPEEKLGKEERARLERASADLSQRADALYQKGQLPEATKLLEQALAMNRRLYPEKRYPQGHP